MFEFIIFAIITITQYLFDRISGRNRLQDKVLAILNIKMRRIKALKIAKKFIQKQGIYCTLKNKYIKIIYNTHTKIMKCYNEENRKQTIKVSGNIQNNFNYDRFNDTRLDEMFDRFCHEFNSQTKYTEIAQNLKEDFIVYETKEINEKPLYKINSSNEIFQGQTIDINSATEQEITDLPGINIVMAKKIIEYRNLHDGFDDLDEFYSEMKIKPHFIKQLNKIIFVEENEKSIEITLQQERVIDL